MVRLWTRPHSLTAACCAVTDITTRIESPSSGLPSKRGAVQDEKAWLRVKSRMAADTGDQGHILLQKMQCIRSIKTCSKPRGKQGQVRSSGVMSKKAYSRLSLAEGASGGLTLQRAPLVEGASG